MEPEELGVIQPSCSTTLFTTSQKDLHLIASASSSLIHLDSASSVSETEDVSVPLTVVSSSSLPVCESGSPPPAPLSDSTSASQPCLVAGPLFSNATTTTHLEAIPVDNNSHIPPQTQSVPRVCHPFEDAVTTRLPETLSNESRIEKTPQEMQNTSPQPSDNGGSQILNCTSDSVA